MFRTLRAVRFLFMGPIILILLIVINLVTNPHNPWWHWAALGIGIAWFISLMRVIQALFVLGGLAALVAYLSRRRQ